MVQLSKEPVGFPSYVSFNGLLLINEASRDCSVGWGGGVRCEGNRLCDFEKSRGDALCEVAPALLKERPGFFLNKRDANWIKGWLTFNAESPSQ